jgi:hypothetical protein
VVEKNIFRFCSPARLVQQSIADHEMEGPNPTASYSALKEYGRRTIFLGFGQQH